MLWPKKMRRSAITSIFLVVLLFGCMAGCSMAQKELTNKDVMTSKHTTAIRINSNTLLNHSAILINEDGLQYDKRDNNSNITPYDGEYIDIGGVVVRTSENSITVKIESVHYGVEYYADFTVYPIIKKHIETFEKGDIIWVTGQYNYNDLSISDAILNTEDIFRRSYSECIGEAIEIDNHEFFYDERKYSRDDRIRLNRVYVGSVEPTHCVIWYDEVDTDSIFGTILDAATNDNRGLAVYFNDSNVYSQIKAGDWIDISGIVYDHWGRSIEFANLLNTYSYDSVSHSPNSEQETAMQTASPQPNNEIPNSHTNDFPPIFTPIEGYSDVLGEYIDEYGRVLVVSVGTGEGVNYFINIYANQSDADNYASPLLEATHGTLDYSNGYMILAFEDSSGNGLYFERDNFIEDNYTLYVHGSPYVGGCDMEPFLDTTFYMTEQYIDPMT